MGVGREERFGLCGVVRSLPRLLWFALWVQLGPVDFIGEAADHPEAEEGCDPRQRPDGRDVQAPDHWDVIKDPHGVSAHGRTRAPAVGEVNKGQSPEYAQRAEDRSQKEPREEAPPALPEHPARNQAGHYRPEEDQQSRYHYGLPRESRLFCRKRVAALFLSQTQAIF